MIYHVSNYKYIYICIQRYYDASNFGNYYVKSSIMYSIIIKSSNYIRENIIEIQTFSTFIQNIKNRF